MKAWLALALAVLLPAGTQGIETFCQMRQLHHAIIERLSYLVGNFISCALYRPRHFEVIKTRRHSFRIPPLLVLISKERSSSAQNTSAA
jgi:hypothetical protein